MARVEEIDKDIEHENLFPKLHPGMCTMLGTCGHHGGIVHLGPCFCFAGLFQVGMSNL